MTYIHKLESLLESGQSGAEGDLILVLFGLAVEHKHVLPDGIAYFDLESLQVYRS